MTVNVHVDAPSSYRSGHNRPVPQSAMLVWSKPRPVVLSAVLTHLNGASHSRRWQRLFYGKPVPTELLSHFKQVLVESDNIDNIEQLISKGVDVFAYLSVGEINASFSEADFSSL